MSSLNLKRIIEISGISPTVLGRELFPKHKHPYKAVNYVCNGKNQLNAEQIAKLAEILNVPIGLLFESAEWRMGMPAGKDKRVLQFRTYDYFAELDLDTMTTTASENGQLLFKTITHEKSVGLTEYLSTLTELLIKHKS